MIKTLFVCAALLIPAAAASAQERGQERTRDTEPVFSGPLPGEKLPPLPVRVLSGKEAGQKRNLAEHIGEQPAILIFVHSRTRPGFALANTVMRFAASRQKEGLVGAYVFLTDDVTEIENWTKRVNSSFFPEGILRTVSPDGIEGPGAYGLNRNVTLTVLIAKSGRVTANFALVQPSEQADGPRIFKALVEALGGGDVPDIAKFSNRRYSGQVNIRELVEPLIRKEATPAQVEAAARNIEKAMRENRAVRRELARISRTIVESGKLANYGTAPAQEYLKKWAEELNP